jgi:hypothetical protein
MFMDFLGEEPKIYIYGAGRYKTKFGALISILAATAILSLSLYFIIAVVSRKQMNLVSTKVDDFTKSIDLNTIPFLFQIQKSLGTKVTPDTVYALIQTRSYYPASQSTPVINNIPLKVCNSTDLLGYDYLFTNVNLTDYMCLDRAGFAISLFGTNGDINNGYSKIQIYMTKCTNGSALNLYPDKPTCLPTKDIDALISANVLQFYMVYPDININFSNTTDPFYSYLRTELFTFPLQANYKYLYYFKKVFLHSDLGFVFDDDNVDQSFQFDHIESLAYIGSNFSVKDTFGLISFVLNDKGDSHKRSYYKFQTLVANIGGIISFIFTISQSIVSYITSKLLLLSYLNERKVITEPMSTSANNTTVNNFMTKPK